MAAVAELRYQPNLAARALASIRTNAIGVIVPSLTMHIFTDVLRGIDDGVRHTDLRVLLGNSHYDNDEEERLIRDFLGQKPAAMILSGTEQTPAARAMLKDANCPVIQIMDLHDDPIECIIGFSHFEAGYMMTRHLIDMGYRRIGFMAGWINQRSRGRLDGWRRALEEVDLYDPRLVTASVSENGSTRTSRPASPDLRLGEAASAIDGRKMLQQLLRIDQRLDAVFCNNDIFAIGVLFEAQAMGLDVPNRLGIAGFNDTDLVRAANPPLSSLRTPRHEIGRRAVQEAVLRLEAPDRETAVIDLGISVSARLSTNWNAVPGSS